MSDNIKLAITELQEKVREQEEQLSKTKQAVNQLCGVAGLPPMYADEASSSRQSTLSALRSDQFYGKPLATAIREYLEMRRAIGKGAASVNKIYDALRSGGYKFETDDAENAKRNLRLSLAKNTVTFHKVPTGDWGLLQWYPNAKATDNDSESHPRRRRTRKTKHPKHDAAPNLRANAPPRQPEPSNGTGDAPFGHGNAANEDFVFKVIGNNFTGNFDTTELNQAVIKEKPELAGHKSEISYALSGLYHRNKVRRIQKGAGKRPGIYCKV